MDKKSQQQITIEHFDKTVDFWHRIYEQHETFTGYSLIKQHEFTVQYITEHASIGAAVLDVGCGAGITILELAQRGYQVSGVDLAPMMIEKAQELARKQGLSCDLRVASADRLPYDNETFDRVIALGLLGNLRDDAVCLAEIWRVLRPQGQILVSVPNFLGMDRWIAVPRSLPLILGHEFRVRYRKFLNAVKRFTGFHRNDQIVRFGRSAVPSRYTSHLRQHGFAEVRYRSLTFGPFFPFGMPLVSDATSIRFSERLCRYRLLNPLGNIVIFHGKKTDR